MSAAAANPAQSLTERLAWAVELVLRGLSLSLPRSREVLPVAPLAGRTWNRLKRLAARFAALVAAVEAGRLSTTRHSPAGERKPRQVTREKQVAGPAGRAPAPAAYGWLLALAPELNTRIGRAQIEALLADPALLALLARAPQAGRLLRPLCHMLRIEQPECLRLPPRSRRPRPARSGDPKPAREAAPQRPKPPWLRWPKSPPLLGTEPPPGFPPRRRTGTGPPHH